MNEAPERIYSGPSVDDKGVFWDVGHWDKEPDEGCIEYVRADRIEELEAKLAKAVEALERIEDASKYFGNCPEASETTVRYAHETTRRLARNTLAELTSSVAADNEVKGGKDE